MGADRSGSSTALSVRTAAAVLLPFAAAYALSGWMLLEGRRLRRAHAAS